MSIEDKKQEALGTVLKYGAQSLCPNCHKSSIYRSYLKLHHSCPNCSFDLEPFDQGDGPAFFVMFLVGALVTPFALWMRSLTDMSIWVFMVFITLLTLGLTLLLLPPAKGLLVALQHRHDAVEGRLDSGDDVS
ncbi:MAG: DUF983 domain-containing protein [Sphingomonadales bacterium]